MQASEQTGGIFDVTCAPLINLWGFGFTKFDSITPQLVDSIRHFVGFRKVRLQGNRVMKDDPRILHNLFKLGVCSGTVILRSDNANAPIPPLRVLSFRYHFAADVYHIVRYAFAVEQTRDYVTDSTAAELEQIVQLSERLGLATSGNYRNFYLKDGRKYAHAINPITGYPVQKDILSATIIAHQCMLADAYATAFMTLGSRKARQL